MKNETLFEYFRKVTTANKILFSPSIEVTDVCNANCIFCYRGEESNQTIRDSLDLVEIERIASEMADLGAFNVLISGGEPLCHPDIKQIIKTIRSKGFAVTIVTNGVLINNSLVKVLKEQVVSNVIVSMHSIDKEVYNQMMGFHGEILSRVITNVHKLIEAGISTQVSAVLTHLNIDGFVELAHYWEKYGVHVNWQRLVPTIDGSNRNLLPSFSQLEGFFRFLGKENIPRQKPGKSFKCSAGMNGMAVSASGSVIPCPFLRKEIGHIGESLKKLWKSSTKLDDFRKRAFTQPVDLCADCPSTEFCDVCIAGNMNATGNMFKIDEDFCVFAHSARKVYYESE